MFKTSLAVASISIILAGCEPNLVAERPPFPEGVWNVLVENDLRNEEIYTDGGRAFVSEKTVTIYRNNIDAGCYDTWFGRFTDDTYTELTDGSTVTIFGEEYDDEISLYVAESDADDASLYIEASWHDSISTTQEFAEQNNICD